MIICPTPLRSHARHGGLCWTRRDRLSASHWHDDEVHLVQVDVLRPPPPQARLARAPEVVGGQPAVVRTASHGLVHLRGQDDVVMVSRPIRLTSRPERPRCRYAVSWLMPGAALSVRMPCQSTPGRREPDPTSWASASSHRWPRPTRRRGASACPDPAAGSCGAEAESPLRLSRSPAGRSGRPQQGTPVPSTWTSIPCVCPAVTVQPTARTVPVSPLRCWFFTLPASRTVTRLRRGSAG